MALIDKLAKGRPDNFQTPEWPVHYLLDVISQYSQDEQALEEPLWDPCCGEGQILKAFGSYEKVLLDYIGTDVATGVDFLSEQSDKIGSVAGPVITNPPYSIKDDFIAKCYAREKPFALLMPLSALEGQKRQPLYQKHGLQLILLPRRVNFKTPSGKGSGSHFATAWFTNGFFLPRDIFILGDEDETSKIDKDLGLDA